MNLALDAFVVGAVRARTAKELTVAEHLALVDNIFTALFADDPVTVLADDRCQRDGQPDLCRAQQFARGHDLVRRELCVPAVRRVGCIILRSRARLGMRDNPDSAPALRIYERRGA